MYKNNILKHKLSGELLRLVTLRDSNLNTYLVVDQKGNPIIKKQGWSVRPKEQQRLIKGFENLELYR